MSQDDTDTPGSAPTPESHQGTGSADSKSKPARPTRTEADQADEPTAEAVESEEREEARTEVRSDRVQGGIEAILLAADRPIPRDELLETFDGVEASDIDRALERIELEFSGPGRGIHLERVGGGYQLRTNPEFGDAVREHVEANPVSLSRAAMETLAIIAYQQPVTRAEIEEIRGVDSSGVLRTLADYELVHVVGRLDDIGRPHVYGTTDRFLELFGLDDLTDLPTLSEDDHEALQELYRDELESFDEEFE